MKRHSLLLLVGAVALLTACIPSVNPFYTAKDLVFDPRLVGEWRGKEEADEGEIWKFETDTNKTYQLIISEKEGKQGKFKAHLLKLKNEQFLDLIPTDCDYADKQAELVAFSMFPGHLLVRVVQLEPELKLAFFDFDWLQKHLEANPKSLAHHQEGERIVLTATTKELQKFVLKHLGEGELFDKVGELVRASGATNAIAEPK
jgi:hypothetical protein